MCHCLFAHACALQWRTKNAGQPGDAHTPSPRKARPGRPLGLEAGGAKATAYAGKRPYTADEDAHDLDGMDCALMGDLHCWRLPAGASHLVLVSMEIIFMGGRLKGTAHCHALLRDTGRKISPGITCRDVRCPVIMDALTTMRWREHVILLVWVSRLFAHTLKLRP